MKMKLTFLFVILALVLILAGCGGTSDEELAQTQAFESALQTAIVETIAAALPKITATELPEATNPPEVPLTLAPTNTLPALPTQAPSQTLDPQASAPTNTPQIPCYRAELIEETIPDGTKFPPGQYFTKIWVIRNTGVCAWEDDFRWKLVEGEDFNGYTNLPLNQTINPGEDLTVKLELKTPLLQGQYKGTYQILTDQNASITPLGFWVLIISEKP